MTTNKPKSGYITLLVQSITTIHGTNRLSLIRGRSLRLWSCLMLANVLLTITFIIVIKDKFNENQVVTQINPNCKVSQVPFPAVSICNYNLVSLRESSNIIQLLKHYNRSQSEIEDFFNALPHLKDFGKESRNIGSFTEVMRILKHHYFTMDTIMEEVHQRCDNLLLYCSFNRNQKRCDDIFSLIKTYEGYCCAFNYAALNDASEVPLLPPDSDMEYYDDQNQGGSAQTGTIISTSESGSASGLSVILNVEPDDYPSWSNTPFYGAKVLVSDPNDYPETTILYRYISLGETVDIKVEAMVYQSESDLRRIEPEKRGCWFYDEVALAHTDRYSFETCNTECRMKTYLQMCGCVPYKYPREKTIRICELEDMTCLNNVNVYKSKNDMNCTPVCFQECRDKKYSMTSDLVPFLGDKIPTNITQNYNISSLAKLQVYFGKSNCNCYKLTLLIDVNYFIATYGGVFGLSFGGSVLTLFELIYLIIYTCIKSVVSSNKNKKKETHSNHKN